MIIGKATVGVFGDWGAVHAASTVRSDGVRIVRMSERQRLQYVEIIGQHLADSSLPLQTRQQLQQHMKKWGHCETFEKASL